MAGRTDLKDLIVRKIDISGIPALVLSPRAPAAGAPGVLWIHGGGYFLGMKEMVFMGRAPSLVRLLGATVVAPGYRLAPISPYPAALTDCFRALEYLHENADSLGVSRNRLIVGGESAGGGLAVAVCLFARDVGAPRVAFQLPLYPMLDSRDTWSSAENRGRVWNSRLNRFGWRLYLRGGADASSPYASPAREDDLTGLPPCYTFVGDGEPFFAETAAYVDKLKKAGVPAEIDVYHTDVHAFDMLMPGRDLSKLAAANFGRRVADARDRFFPEGT